MHYFLITDNHDNLTGLRLAGIEGVLVKSRSDCIREITKAVSNPEIAILIISESLALLCCAEMNQLKQNSRLLVVEIPAGK